VRARNQRRRGGTNCVKKIEPNLYNAQQYKQQKNNNALSSKSEPYFQGDKTTATRQISSIHLKKEVVKIENADPKSTRTRTITAGIAINPQNITSCINLNIKFLRWRSYLYFRSIQPETRKPSLLIVNPV
jgi:hypothetical protein